MNQPLKIAVLGGAGMLGKDLCAFLGAENEVVPITRENYASYIGKEFDVLINANGNSKRFWANQNPIEDFNASTLSVYQSLLDFKCKKYIYISSINVYENTSSPDTTQENRLINPAKLQPYGFHKYLSELIIAQSGKNYLILRCPIILGKVISRGTFFDILNSKPLFVTPESKLQLITTKAIAEIIMELLSKNVSNETFNLGGEGTFPLSEAETYFSKPISISKDAESQVYEMNIEKIKSIYPVKKSSEYLKEFLSAIDTLKPEL